MSATTASGAQAQSQMHEVDPISKFKLLIPPLKESLAKLMKVSAQAFHHNAQLDSCIKAGESAQRFDRSEFERSLEEFYAYCDQIEMNLRLALDCNLQQADSNKHTPIPVQGMAGKDAQGRPLPPQGQGVPEPHQYSQYLCLVKEQLTCAKEVHDMLLSYSKKLSEKQLVPQQAATPQQTSVHPPQQVT